MTDNVKVSYQTLFSGIKYNNNPLVVDINSFSDANNVYLNKYNALISRHPVQAKTFAWQVYGVNPIPIYLKLVGSYNLSNGGIVYVIFDTNTNLYKLRYKSPLDVYSEIITSVTIGSYKDFAIVPYKQYYIIFTVDGARVLNTDSPSNTWGNLNNYVDIPITVIQTGNERLELDGNQLTGSYKEQFVIKTDSDDTIYSLPDGLTAQVSFPLQSNVTYSMTKANEYTRDRILRRLALPLYDFADTIISMIGDKIAIAHSDRFDLSLNYGDAFMTIIYPTTSIGYKNTASLSDDGQYFFYVHTDGVYRYNIGTGVWVLIEVQLEPTHVLDPIYTTMTIERNTTGVEIKSAHMIGANYCHFVNGEKFAFMLAYRVLVEGAFKWISVLYTKGLNITNLFDQTFNSDPLLLNSYAYISGVPINIIGDDSVIWATNPYLNKRMVKVLDDNTVVFYAKATTLTTQAVILKAAPTHVYRYGSSPSYNTSVDYVAVKQQTFTFASEYEINELGYLLDNQVKLLIKRTNIELYWITHTYAISYVTGTDGGLPIYTITFTLTESNTTYLTGNANSSSIIHDLTGGKYLVGSSLQIFDSSNSLADTYLLPLSLTVTSNVIISGPYYLIYHEASSIWYTNIPIQTTLVYTYIDNSEFTQVPTAMFADQNLWLGMNKTLWIANLVDNKLSAIPLNNNVFSKMITGICPISTTSKAIFFNDSLTLADEVTLSNNDVAWYYYPLKFTVGVRQGDTVITTNDGKFTIFPTKYGLAALTYQLNIAATDQAITYLSDDIKTLWSEFYNASTAIKIIHHNTQLILSNGTNKILIFDFRTNGWYPLTLPANIKVSIIQPDINNYEILELQPADVSLTNLTGLYQISKESDELYSYEKPYRDLGTMAIPWSLTSQILLLDAPNNYKNIKQLIIDQVDSSELKQSAYLTTQLFRQRGNLVKPSVELIYDIDTFAKIIYKVNWWKVLGIKWQLNHDAKSAYPTQLRLYNVSTKYEISYEVK